MAIHYPSTFSILDSVNNRWDELLITHTLSWFAITDKAAAKGFYEGTNGRILWDAWLHPLSFYRPFAFTFFFPSFACNFAEKNG
ncbi:MAG: hypothetical protein NZ805_09915 [Armatimonadetes bacterium]|nr:hypothetical protein [Armatimonadota bacterium]MDW8029120.1 DUF6785 family protein [Armatimonadota bacterium]